MHTIQAQHHPVYELTDKSFAVFGPVKASNTLGFCHVRNEKSTNPGSQFYFKYTGEDCNTYVSKRKQEKMRSIYIHLHTLFCSLQLANGMPAVADPPSTSALATHSSCPPSEDFQSHRICFTSCYNETVYNQNTSLPFWHRFDVSDQDERCLDISRFKWWMSIIVRSWKQGLQSIIPVAEEAVFYTQTWTHSRKWSYMWVNAQNPHAKPCIAYFLQTQVRPLNFVMKRSCKHCERFWDYPTGRFFCC